MKKEKENKQNRALELAEKIKLLFGFVMDLAKDKDLLKETADLARERESFALSGAPILGAMGINYEEKELNAKIRKERANAILHLIETLEKTEKEMISFKKKQAEIEKNKAILNKILGV